MARRPIFRVGPLSTARVEAFSDGVLAIVITLLILEVKLPTGALDDAGLWRAIARLTPVLLAWAVSFAFVLVFWVNHNYFMASLRAADRGLLWLNGLFLFCITFTPFPTGLVGQYPGATAPLALLSASMLMTSLSMLLMRLYASWHGGLLTAALEAREIRRGLLISSVAPGLYALALVLSFLWPPGAVALQVLVLLIFFLRSPARHPARDDDHA